MASRAGKLIRTLARIYLQCPLPGNNPPHSVKTHGKNVFNDEMTLQRKVKI